jgi:hypothetical protein
MPLGLSMRYHIPPLSGDFSLLTYSQNDKTEFKQMLFWQSSKIKTFQMQEHTKNLFVNTLNIAAAY